MRAACFDASGKPLEIRDVPDPTPGPGEVLLAVRGCGICGSDLHVTELGGAVPNGAVMGHEFAGEIVAVGDPKDVSEAYAAEMRRHGQAGTMQNT